MARITTFRREPIQRVSLHDPIDATIYGYELDGRKLLQINSVGRSSRKLKGKVSQSIQLDETSARQLYDELQSHFGFR